MITKIIIFGVNGMLGNYIYNYMSKMKQYNTIYISRKEFDVLTHVNNIEEFLLSKNIDNKTCVINCIGLIPQRFKNSKNFNEYYIINSIFPQLLAKYCKKYSAKMIQPTTDCVYNGNKGKYIETDFHDETNIYGVSKSLGESDNCTVIRTSIIGEEIYNKYSLLEWVKNSKGIINGFTNHLWNGITCLQYCKLIDEIIKNNLFWNGVKHIYSPVAKSKYELCCIIKDVYDIDIQINKMENSIIVDKTLSSIYNLSFNIPILEDQIKEQKQFKIYNF
jgi:dTDP-4-dehydrorhamnose reductase